VSEIRLPTTVEEIADPLNSPGRALGRDPFDDLTIPDPCFEQLDQLEARRADSPAPQRRAQTAAAMPATSEPTSATPTKFEAGSAKPTLAAKPTTKPTTKRTTRHSKDTPPSRDNLARISQRRWSTTPPLTDIDLPPAKGWLDRLLNPEERRVLASLAHLVEGDSPYDRFGYSPEALKTAFPLFHALYRLYFRVRSEGHEHIPSEGPAVLAGNHGGLLPFDAAMAIIDIALHTDPPRLARTIVDRWAGALPWVNIFYARVGQVVGTRENFAKLLDDGQLLLVYPEGIEGMRKTIAHRYRLQEFRVGFIERALRARAPIVPVAFIGSDDQSPILFDLKPLARRLGVPVAPITPTFPWFGPLGLLPYPVSYRIIYGEPLRYHERFGPEGADDARLVRYLANQVRRNVQLLIDRNRQ
jgi:1-acyl-sn-glycerol-3-phosphate acyltransferase